MDQVNSFRNRIIINPFSEPCHHKIFYLLTGHVGNIDIKEGTKSAKDAIMAWFHIIESGRRDLNLRPPAPQAGALNHAALRPDALNITEIN